MFCQNCGKEIDDKAAICIHCGVQTGVKLNQDNDEDNGSIGWGVLGFCVPIAGLILFLVWKDTKPKCSKAAGIGALASSITLVVGMILFYLFMFLMFTSLFFAQ